MRFPIDFADVAGDPLASVDVPSWLTYQRAIEDREEGAFTRHLEVDLAPTVGLRARHRLIRAEFRAEEVLGLADFYRSFWDGAPAVRGVLLLLPRVGVSTFDRVYGQDAPVWGGVEWIDADCGEVAALYQARGRGLFLDGGELRCRDEAGFTPLQTNVFAELTGSRRIIFLPAGHQDMRRNLPPPKDVGLIVPLGRYGGRVTEQSREGVAINSGYFVWTEEEFVEDPACRVPDPVGLVVEQGRVLFPPLYSRPALMADDSGALYIQAISMADCDIDIRGYRFSGRLAITRARQGPIQGPDHGSTRIAVVGETVVGLVRDPRQGYCPGNGFLLDVPDALASELRDCPSISYHLNLGRSVESGCQGSITLARGGQALDLERECLSLELTTTPACIGGIPPNHLTGEVLLGDKRAQIAVGMSPEGRVMLHHVEHTEPRSLDKRFDSVGCAVSVVRDRLCRRGADSAIALDGGGSAIVAVHGELFATPADRFDVMHLPRERLVPSCWTFTQD